MADDSKDLILLSDKGNNNTCALSPRHLAHAAECLKHGFEERLCHPLSNALNTSSLVTALTTLLTTSNLEGLPLLVHGFTDWYTRIFTDWYTRISTASNLTPRDSLTKPVQVDLWLIRAGMSVAKSRVSEHIERYLKVFACADSFSMQKKVRQEILNTRQSRNSPLIEEVRNDHVLPVWLKNNLAELTKGNATATVIGNMQRVQRAQGDTLTVVQKQCNANSRKISAMSGYKVSRMSVLLGSLG